MTTRSFVRRLAGLAALALVLVALGGAPVRAKGMSQQGMGSDDPAAIDPWAVWSTHGYDKVGGGLPGVDAYGAHMQNIDPSWTSWDAAKLAQAPIGATALQQVVLPGPGVTALVPTDRMGDAARAEALRTMSLHWLADIQRDGGPFATQLASGAVAGLEFDWWPDSQPKPLSTTPLYTIAALTARYDASSPEVLLGYVYAYSQLGFDVRRTALALQGIPLEAPVTVFSGDVITVTDRRLDLTMGGVGLLVDGNVCVRDDVIVTVPGATLRGDLTLGDELVQDGPLAIEGQVRVGTPGTVGLPFSLSEARALAIAAGTYHAGDAFLLGNLPPNALVFAERDIRVDAWGVSAQVTLVSATGNITITGGGLSLTAKKDHVLALAFAGRVDVQVSDSVLTGWVAAPNSEVRVASTASRLVTRILAKHARLEGTGLTVTDGGAVPPSNGPAVPELPPTPSGGGAAAW